MSRTRPGGELELSSVYVSVEDMDRALDFYRELFGREPEQAQERFSTFEFDGVDFGLYDPSYDGHAAEFGDNCVPNFEVDDVHEAYDRIAALAPAVLTDGVLEIDDYHTIHVRDTEDNTIEVFSIE